ncbi:hypothetical protein [Psychrobacter sp. JCM 18900]|nr:hypothetical protein [Psychrobacter sp. JCM 18900]
MSNSNPNDTKLEQQRLIQQEQRLKVKLKTIIMKTVKQQQNVSQLT